VAWNELMKRRSWAVEGRDGCLQMWRSFNEPYNVSNEVVAAQKR